MNSAGTHASAPAIVALRQVRGYSATNHDDNAAAEIQTLRRQFGEKYDEN